jgi:hypothetical protein
MFGGLFDKKEKAEYEATIKQMEMQNQIQMQKQLHAQMLNQRPGLLTGSIGSINQAQGLTSVSDSTTSGSIILRNMQNDIRELRVNIEHISGFYRWVIHAYPETLVQYKALKDLEAASRQNETTAGEQYAAKSAI